MIGYDEHIWDLYMKLVIGSTLAWSSGPVHRLGELFDYCNWDLVSVLLMFGFPENKADLSQNGIHISVVHVLFG